MKNVSIQSFVESIAENTNQFNYSHGNKQDFNNIYYTFLFIFQRNLVVSKSDIFLNILLLYALIGDFKIIYYSKSDTFLIQSLITYYSNHLEKKYKFKVIYRSK